MILWLTARSWFSYGLSIRSLAWLKFCSRSQAVSLPVTLGGESCVHTFVFQTCLIGPSLAEHSGNRSSVPKCWELMSLRIGWPASSCWLAVACFMLVSIPARQMFTYVCPNPPHQFLRQLVLLSTDTHTHHCNMRQLPTLCLGPRVSSQDMIPNFRRCHPVERWNLWHCFFLKKIHQNDRIWFNYNIFLLNLKPAYCMSISRLHQSCHLNINILVTFCNVLLQ